MKIRNGFVSNSSSSSFICYTAYLKKIDLKDVTKKLKIILEAHNKLSGENLTFDEMFQKPFIVKPNHKISDEYKDFIKEWIFDKDGNNKVYFIKNIEDLNGKLIINSSSDNSIPFYFFDVLSNFFHAERVRLG